MGTNVGEAAKLMKKHSIGSLIIVDKKNGNKAKGIMTERDIVHKIIALKKTLTRQQLTRLCQLRSQSFYLQQVSKLLQKQ